MRKRISRCLALIVSPLDQLNELQDRVVREVAACWNCRSSVRFDLLAAGNTSSAGAYDLY